MNLKQRKRLILLAEEIATNAHRGQFRYDGKTPFIEHPKQVAKIFIDGGMGIVTYREIVVSWLHDVLEDTTIKAKDLLSRGIPYELVNTVEVLTRLDNESYLGYLLRVRKDWLARRVKLADLEHNISTSPGKHQRDKYYLARFLLSVVK